MTRLSPAQIADVARRAGFPEASIRMVTAIALLESGGDPEAHGDRNNPKAGCGSYGLWQINSCPGYGRGHPRWEGTPERLYDPATNAAAALTISNNGTNWKPWSVWKSGKAQKLAPTLDLGSGDPIAQSPTSSPPPSSSTNSPPAGKIDPSSPAAWKRVLAFTAGTVLAIVGLSIAGVDLTI